MHFFNAQTSSAVPYYDTVGRGSYTGSIYCHSSQFAKTRYHVYCQWPGGVFVFVFITLLPTSQSPCAQGSYSRRIQLWLIPPELHGLHVTLIAGFGALRFQYGHLLRWATTVSSTYAVSCRAQHPGPDMRCWWLGWWAMLSRNGGSTSCPKNTLFIVGIFPITLMTTASQIWSNLGSGLMMRLAWCHDSKGWILALATRKCARGCGRGWNTVAGKVWFKPRLEQVVVVELHYIHRAVLQQRYPAHLPLQRRIDFTDRDIVKVEHEKLDEPAREFYPNIVVKSWYLWTMPQLRGCIVCQLPRVAISTMG